jgi:hypothetical protein
MKVYGAYCSDMFLRVFFENRRNRKKVYTSDGTNASDLITRVFFNSCKKALPCTYFKVRLFIFVYFIVVV